MSEALFSATDGFKVIDGLRRGAKNSLLMLNIEDFFQVWFLSGNDTQDIFAARVRNTTQVMFYRCLSVNGGGDDPVTCPAGEREEGGSPVTGPALGGGRG